MNNTTNTINLTTAKLFDITALAKHLLEYDHYLFLDSNAKQNTFGCSGAQFSLYYDEDIKNTLRENPLPNDISLSFYSEIMRNAPISEIMEYLIRNDVINDEEIFHSWNEHLTWHTELESRLFPVSIADFVYPDSYPEPLYVYSDIWTIQRFADLLTTITEVSFCPEALDSQYAIINEMLPFVVNDLIPITWGTDAISAERITELVQKISVYLAKLFWIYTL